jgi:cytochrome c
MKIVIASVVVALGALSSASVFAAGEKDLATKSGCLACHAVDKKLVGPAYQDVAKKYAGDKTAEAKLTEKVKKGGSGVWGAVPMPPNSAVSDKDIKTLVKWVLAGAK